MKRTKVVELLRSPDFGKEINVRGWVRTKRGNKNVAFIAINDGSVIHNIQVVVELTNFSEADLAPVTTGSCISVDGTLVESKGQGQSVEILAKKIEVFGTADPEKFPLQKKAHTLEFLREIAHLRPRTNTFGAVLRIRHHMSYAIHKFFNDKGFFNLHSPIITGSDAEGAGEMFRVTTLNLLNLPLASEKFNQIANDYLKAIKKVIKESEKESYILLITDILKSYNKDWDFDWLITANLNDLRKIEDYQIHKLTEAVNDLFINILRIKFFEVRQPSSDQDSMFPYVPDWLVKKINPNRADIRTYRLYEIKDGYSHLSLSFYNFVYVIRELNNAKDRVVDFKEDFFGKETNLTVSGQLEGELAAMALGLIYTFGPTFRAENSNTPRHLAEFWMIEPEMAFYDIHDNMDLAEELLKYLVHYAMENCKDDLEFLDKRAAEEDKTKKESERSKMSLLEKLKMVSSHPFKRLTYTEAIDVLRSSGKKFEFKVEWGVDLQKEHETFLVDHFKTPVILTDYPKEIKSFYMKLNEDGKTVRAMDVLFPYIGEIIGGSQREEDLEKLLSRIKEKGIREEGYWWYLETRKYGTCPHSGFGLGFERLLMFVTGMTNMRDVIPFPRTPKNAEF